MRLTSHISGYEHFGQSAQAPSATGKCQLWDDTRTIEYEQVEAARAQAVAEIREKIGDPDAVVSEEELAKLGLQKPKPRQPGAGYAHAPARVVVPPPPRYEFRYRYAIPAPRAGVSVASHQAEVARVNAHNALLDAVGNNFEQYRLHLERARDHAVAGQDDEFPGEGPIAEACRLCAAYYRQHPRHRGEPMPGLMAERVEIRPHLAGPAAHVIPPAPFDAPAAAAGAGAAAIPPVPAPHARRRHRRVRVR